MTRSLVEWFDDLAFHVIDYVFHFSTIVVANVDLVFKYGHVVLSEGQLFP